MFDYEIVKVLEAGIWCAQHVYLLLLLPLAIVIAALTDKGDK